MNAYKFIKKALTISNNQITPLLKLTDFEEVEWLEFKANIIPLIDNRVEKRKLSWNIFKAVVALSNSVGGAVLIGLDDNAQFVDILEKHNGNRDKFTRQVEESILYPKQEYWSDYDKKNQETRYYLAASDYLLAEHVELKWVYLDKKPLLAILVKPASAYPILIKQQKEQALFFYRVTGDVGKTEKKDFVDIHQIQKQDSNKYQNFFNNALIQLKKESHLPFEKKLEMHNRHLAEHHLNRIFEQNFIDLNIDLYLPKIEKHAEKQSLPAWSWINKQDIQKNALSFRQVSSAVNRFIITGEPGSGKSTCLAYFIQSNIEQKKLNKVHLYAQAKHYNPNLGLMHLLCSTSNIFAANDLISHLNQDVAIYIDGLNECQNIFFPEFMAELNNLIHQYQNLNIYLSARNTQKIEQLPLPRIYLNSLTKKQSNTLLTTLLGNDQNDRLFVDELNKKPGKEHILASPLLLTIIHYLHKSKQSIPEGIASLYQVFIKDFFSREKEEKLKDLSMSMNELMTYFSELAFIMQINGRTQCDLVFIEKIFANKMPDFAHEPFLVSLSEGLIFNYNPKTGFSFAHETLQEYFCAEFLVVNNQFDLSKSSNMDGQWDLPIIFAYELTKTPSIDFVESAWKVSPIISSAACQDLGLLRGLKITSTNLWEEAFLKLLRGENYDPQLEDIVIAGRLPPKYPMPENLIRTLKSNHFWYALTTYDDGKIKANNIESALKDGSIWVELFLILGSMAKMIFSKLNTIQQILSKDTHVKIDEEDLKLASAVELCLLLRERAITDKQFQSSWKNTLSLSSSKYDRLNLLLLYRTNKIKAEQFESGQISELKTFSHEENLSFRLLSKLIDDNIIDKKVIADNDARLNEIIKDASILNLHRFTRKNKILTRDKLSYLQIKSIVERIKTFGDFEKIISCGLLKKSDFPRDFEASLKSRKTTTFRSGDKNEIKLLAQNEISALTHELAMLEARNLSDEEALFEKLKKEAENPVNQDPSGQYHKKLIQTVQDCDNWENILKQDLIDFALQFFARFASKKKKKDYLKIVKSKI